MAESVVHMNPEPKEEPAPKFLVKSHVLEDTMYLRRESYVLEFFAYETMGCIEDNYPKEIDMEKRAVLPDENEPPVENEKTKQAADKSKCCGGDTCSKMAEAAASTQKPQQPPAQQ